MWFQQCLPPWLSYDSAFKEKTPELCEGKIELVKWFGFHFQLMGPSLLEVLILCFCASQYKSNETRTWCNTVQVLFLQSHSTCFGRKRPSSVLFKTITAATGTCVIVAGKSSCLLRRCDDLPATITRDNNRGWVDPKGHGAIGRILCQWKIHWHQLGSNQRSSNL